MAKDDSDKFGGGVALGWFWIGAGLGVVLSATAVVVATEFREGRRSRRRGQLLGYEQGESDLIEDLTSAVSGGLSALAETADMLSNTFNAARSELIKFNLDSSGAGQGSGASGWYDGEDVEYPVNDNQREEA